MTGAIVIRSKTPPLYYAAEQLFKGANMQVQCEYNPAWQVYLAGIQVLYEQTGYEQDYITSSS